MFITFEGGEGAGKSTQARRLAERLEEAGHEVVLTREPGGSPFAESIRAAVLSDRGRALPADEQAILFAAARADHVDSLILPGLARGAVVLCDRFADSTLAYQGAAGASPALLAMLHRVSVGRAVPDLTLILDIAPEVGLTRVAGRTDVPDAFERDEIAVHAARRAAFLEIARQEPARCVVLDASQDEDALAEAIHTIVADRLAPQAAA